jgi:hypothetical protein
VPPRAAGEEEENDSMFLYYDFKLLKVVYLLVRSFMTSILAIVSAVLGMNDDLAKDDHGGLRARAMECISNKNEGCEL